MWGALIPDQSTSLEHVDVEIMPAGFVGLTIGVRGKEQMEAEIVEVEFVELVV